MKVQQSTMTTGSCLTFKQIFVGLLFLIQFSFSLRLLANASDPDNFTPNIKPHLVVPRSTGSIRVDGNLEEDTWNLAAVATNFAETNPGDQTKPLVRTKVLVAYDEQFLYVAFLAYDNPDQIRASLRDRDQIWQDDNIGIILDTYGQASWGYEIFVNPLGIQGDILVNQEGNEDTGFDLIYKSKGKITAEGYQVEVAIPFSSLRFPHREEQTWRATFWRNHPRDSRHQYSWAAIDRDEPCWMCQFGTLSGIHDVQPGNPLEIMPSLVGFQSGHLETDSDPQSPFKNENVNEEVSLGLRYAISPSLTTEATYNPDFSQVESDADQIDVNTTFALFFPEKRPFFQEGSDLFDSYFDIFYTRSINDPLLAGKLTGRMNRWSVAYLAAYDEHTPLIIPFEERSSILELRGSTSNILRLKRTNGDNSYAGLYFTDRRLDQGGSNTVFGVDGVQSPSKNYYFEWQVLASYTNEPADTSLSSGINDLTFDRNKHTAAFDGESFGGHAYYLSFERHARLWNFDYDYRETGPSFRADNGFITQNSRRLMELWSGLNFRPNTKIFDQITPNFVLGKVWNDEWLRKDQYFIPILEFNLKAQTYMQFYYLWSQERFRDIDFRGIRRFEFEANTRFLEAFNIGAYWESGRFIARNLDTPVLGKGYNSSIDVMLKPMQRLIIEPSITYARLHHPANDTTIFDGYIFRSRLNFQFTRELFLRFILQYNNFNHQLSLEPLLTYRLNPFSLFYIGSTHDYHEFDNRNNFDQTSRQFFLKFQYLFRI